MSNQVVANRKVVNALKKLTTFYNPATTDGGSDDESDEDDEEDDFDAEGNKKNVNYVFNSSLVSDPGLPKHSRQPSQDQKAKSG